MKYWVFAGARYCASGGMRDFVGMFEDLEKAKQHAESLMGTYTKYDEVYDWWHIVDVGFGGMVAWCPDHEYYFLGWVPPDQRSKEPPGPDPFVS